MTIKVKEGYKKVRLNDGHCKIRYVRVRGQITDMELGNDIAERWVS